MPEFGFALETDGDAWRWRTLDRHGRTEAQGIAETRAVAAALMIRALLDKTLGGPRPVRSR